MKKQKFDIAETVTNNLIEIIEKTGKLPWEKEWSASGSSFFGVNAPRSFETKKPYRGSNVLMLLSRGFSSPWFLTFKQAKAKGGNVIRGSKGTMIIWWSLFMLDENGKPTKDESKAAKKIPTLKYSTVFNATQIEGIDFPKVEAPKEKEKNEAIAQAEAVLDSYENAPLSQFGGDSAHYSPALDKVVMPTINSFNCSQSFYKTYFHEMIHSTGHKKRLNRDGITKFDNFGSDQYSKEELIAELGAAFLASITGCWGEKQEKNSAAYLKSWVKSFKDDKNMIITAASAAQRAAEHILGGSLNDYEPLPEEMKPQENEERTEYKSKFQGEFLKGR